MPMYNLLEYSDNYSMTSGSLWNYYRDEINDDGNENNAANNRINNNKTITSKSFECKTKSKGSTTDNNNILDTKVVVPLKYLSNFLRSLDLPLINCEIELDLSWLKECIKSEISMTPTVPGNRNANPPVPDMAPVQKTAIKFQMNNAELYVPVATPSINDNIKFLENIKQGFKRTISLNKSKSEITIQPKNNNFDYLIDPTFRNTQIVCTFIQK